MHSAYKPIDFLSGAAMRCHEGSLQLPLNYFIKDLTGLLVNFRSAPSLAISSLYWCLIRRFTGTSSTHQRCCCRTPWTGAVQTPPRWGQLRWTRRPRWRRLHLWVGWCSILNYFTFLTCLCSSALCLDEKSMWNMTFVWFLLPFYAW